MLCSLHNIVRNGALPATWSNYFIGLSDQAYYTFVVAAFDGLHLILMIRTFFFRDQFLVGSWLR